MVVKYDANIPRFKTLFFNVFLPLAGRKFAVIANCVVARAVNGFNVFGASGLNYHVVVPSAIVKYDRYQNDKRNQEKEPDVNDSFRR